MAGAEEGDRSWLSIQHWHSQIGSVVDAVESTGVPATTMVLEDEVMKLKMMMKIVKAMHGIILIKMVMAKLREIMMK